MSSEEFKLSNSPTDAISCVDFSSTEQSLLLVASWDKNVTIHDVTKNILRTRYTHDAAVLSACFSLDSTHCFSGGLDFTVRSFDLSSEKQMILGTHDKGVKSICAVPGNPFILVSGSWDGKLKMWDFRSSNSTPITQKDLGKKVYAMDVTPNGSKLVVGTNNRQVEIFELANNTFILHQRRESSLKYQTRCIKCNIHNTGYALSSIEGRVAIEYFDPSPQVQQQKYAFKCHRSKNSGVDVLYPVNAISFHPKYGTFATGGSDGYVSVWDGSNKKRLINYHKYPTSIASLSFNCDGSYLAIASSYTFEEGEKSEKIPDEVYIRNVQDADVKPKQTVK